MSREQIGQFLNDITLMTDTEQQDGDVVKLMTIHSSKGLEFDYVFVVGCEEGNFPGNNAAMDMDELEEERRLMYVAITRAKDHLFLSHVDSRMIWGKTVSSKVSRFIEELPTELLKMYDLGSTGTKKRTADLEGGDRVRNKLFGTGTVKEVWGDVAIVVFDKSSVGLRKLDKRMITKM
ncbi:MAG: ATP-dependent helicase [Candidatus Absconditabacterales bacterium]